MPSVIFTLEEKTPYGLVYSLAVAAGSVGARSIGTLYNRTVAQGGSANNSIQIDDIPGSPFAVMMSVPCPSPTPVDIATLIAFNSDGIDTPASGNGLSTQPFRELDVRLTDEIQFQLLGATDYPRWTVNCVADAVSGLVAFFVQAPSAGGTAMLRVRRIHSRGL